jgi:hypothetical protein
LSISDSDSFDEAFISEVDAAGEDSRRICAAHGNDAAGDYKRHRCLRVTLYFRVASVRTEIAGGPENSLYVSVWSRRERVVVFRRFTDEIFFESKAACHDDGAYVKRKFEFSVTYVGSL